MVDVVRFTHWMRDVRMVAMDDLFAIIMTCTPHPRILYTIYYGTLEYSTVRGTNSLVAGPGSGMV